MYHTTITRIMHKCTQVHVNPQSHTHIAAQAIQTHPHTHTHPHTKSHIHTSHHEQTTQIPTNTHTTKAPHTPLHENKHICHNESHSKRQPTPTFIFEHSIRYSVRTHTITGMVGTEVGVDPCRCAHGLVSWLKYGGVSSIARANRHNSAQRARPKSKAHHRSIINQPINSINQTQSINRCAI